MKGGEGLPASQPATTGVNQANTVDAIIMSNVPVNVPLPLRQPPTPVYKPKGSLGNAPNTD